MPIHSCTLPNGKSGYKYGDSGKCYASREDALKQMRAMFYNGYTGSENLSPTEQAKAAVDEFLAAKEILRGEAQKADVHALVFDKSVFTLQEATDYAKRYNFKYDNVDELGAHFRFYQNDPSDFVEMRAIKLGQGVNSILGYKERTH